MKPFSANEICVETLVLEDKNNLINFLYKIIVLLIKI